MAINGTGSWDAWQRECLIEVSDGTTWVSLAALTETVDIDLGERDLDVVNLLNLGQIPKFGGVGLTTVTFEGYALQAGTGTATGAQTGTGFWDLFANKPAMDTSDPLTNAMTNNATRFRVAVLWTAETGETLASGAISAAGLARRFIIADCFCTSCKDSFTDGILKTTLMFKGNAFDNAGSALIQWESEVTGALAALATYVPGTTYFRA